MLVKLLGRMGLTSRSFVFSFEGNTTGILLCHLYRRPRAVFFIGQQSIARAVCVENKHKVYCKRMVAANREKVKLICLAARQFGVAVPGGAEGLVHFRTTLEKILNSSSTPWAVIDVDLQNAFPSLEWDAIRQAVAARLPEVLDWTDWCHESPSRVVLPSGSEVFVDRGAEQGDPLGPIYCALVIAEVMARTHQHYLTVKVASLTSGFWTTAS